MSAKCLKCSNALKGAWNLSKSGTSYDQTGRYLGVSDGYFLHGNTSNWVYCYCHNCWQKEVKKLPFVKSIQTELDQTKIQLTTSQDALNVANVDVQRLSNIEQQLNSTKEELAKAVEELKVAKEKIVAFESQYQHVPDSIALACTKNDFQIFEKIQRIFSTSEVSALVKECNFGGWQITEDAVIHGFGEVLKTCITEATSDLSQCVIKKSDILNKRQQVLKQEIIGLESRLKTAVTPAVVIEKSVAPLKTYKLELEKESQRWTQLQNKTRQLVNSINKN